MPVTIAEFAQTLHVPAERLLHQFRLAGIQMLSESDQVTEDHKQTLLSYLRQKNGTDPAGYSSQATDSGKSWSSWRDWDSASIASTTKSSRVDREEWRELMSDNNGGWDPYDPLPIRWKK